jgi:hypothetical protein
MTPRDILLTKHSCRICGKDRWNDGLKCPHCDSYQNPRAGIKREDPQGLTAFQVLGRAKPETWQ